MSAITIASLNFASQQLTIYLGISTLIAGVIGGFLILVVFLSLRTFRQSPCALYLTVMSVVNIGQMITGLLARIMTSGYNIDWSLTSLFYCKFRYYCFHVCALTSMTCICLATMDQYFATCSRPRWQQWSNIKLARRLVTIFVLIWILHNLPNLIYYNNIVSNTTGKVICFQTNAIFQLYLTYGTTFILGKVLPVFITFFFGFLAYRNVQQLSHRALPLVRRELDKQLTVMVLVQVVFGLVKVIPYAVVSFAIKVLDLSQYPIFAAQLQFGNDLTLCLFYMYFASPFYIFVFVSERFRRQLIYVLFDIYLNRWRQHRRMVINQVMPQI